MLLVRVLLEPVRSAEPPIISGSAGIRLSSANSHGRAGRDFFGSAASFFFTARTASASACGGRSPLHATLEFVRACCRRARPAAFVQVRARASARAR